MHTCKAQFQAGQAAEPQHIVLILIPEGLEWPLNHVTKWHKRKPGSPTFHAILILPHMVKLMRQHRVPMVTPHGFFCPSAASAFLRPHSPSTAQQKPQGLSHSLLTLLIIYNVIMGILLELIPDSFKCSMRLSHWLKPGTLSWHSIIFWSSLSGREHTSFIVFIRVLPSGIKANLKWNPYTIGGGQSTQKNWMLAFIC